MGFLDFLKGKEYRDNNEKENGLVDATDATDEIDDFNDFDDSDNETHEESVEKIVRDVAEEIEEETSEHISEDVVYEVVENVTQIEKEINNDVNEKINNGVKLDTTPEFEAVEDKQVFEEIGDESVIADEGDDAVEEQDEVPQKIGFFAKLKEGLSKTKRNIFGGIEAVLGGFTKIDDELFDELEEALIMGDIGVDTTLKIIESLKKRVKKDRVEDPALITGMLQDEISDILEEGTDGEFRITPPTVLLVIGVNGVGKTTTIGKLAANYKAEGKTVMLAAADTFRAAAIDQLKIWGERSKVEVICHEEKSDPAAVVFDAVNAAKNRKTDVLICDTAGRLHNKKNLMDELKKIAKVISREYPEANTEVFLVLDATTGQNALQQAKLFNEVADITGLVLTKLDGTAKGGIVIAIKNELNIPVRYIGVGEGIADLQPFNPSEFAKALFEK